MISLQENTPKTLLAHKFLFKRSLGKWIKSSTTISINPIIPWKVYVLSSVKSISTSLEIIG